MGLKEVSIKKLFIIGELRSGSKAEWRFHVTAIIEGKSNRWHAVDPIISPPFANEGPKEIDEWVNIIRNIWDKEEKAFLYLTPNHVIIPDVTKDIDGTTGDHIIELVFNPDTKEGFTKYFYNDIKFFKVNEEASFKYMISVNEKDRFNFDGIVIENNYISYNNYFDDLLIGILRGSFYYHKRAHLPQGLYSPNLQALFKK